jgi:NAD(P)-dependent dehydrogenase (short-subunit alcohol dehydrogenase family)/acyl carrier protein
VQTIAKETGYPEATLNPELNLEEDLGLDSIRKVEIFSSISETLPLLEPKDLARATTIGDLFKLADQMETTGPPLPSAPSYAEYFEKPTMDPQALSAGSQIPVGSNSPALKATRTFGSFKATGPSSLASNSAYPLTIEILARETGYPPGSLDPSMDLESDLGLDSIRKVEILSLISEEHGISPSQDQTRLAQARRLSDWLSFFHKDYVDSSSPIAKERGGNPKSYPQPESPKASSSLIQNALDASIKASSQNEMRASNISEFGSPSSYFHEKALMPPAPSEDPEPLIDPDELPKVFSVIASPYTLDSQEIDLKEYSPIVILGSNTLSRSIASHFEDKGLEVSRYPWQEDFTQDSIVPASLILVWPGPDSDPSLITQALKTIQVLGSKLKAIVGITFLGGYFGCPRPEGGGSPIGNSASAALAGLIKCAALEWPGVLARVIDLPLATYEVLFPSMEGNIYQSLFVPGPVEVGLPTGDKIIRSALAPYPLSLSPGSSLPLNEGDTVVATGGARGITARILLELAKHVRLRFVILGRTPPGPREPAWLMVHNTEQEIQMALHKASDGNLAPKELSLRAKLTLNSRELNANIAALEKLGSEVEYLSGNWLDPTWAQASARKLKQAFGPIKGFIHGAGILRDHSILGKDPHDFARVFDTKAQLAQVLLEVFRDEPLSLILFMSSTTARFGRKGQADYAAANEVLNKMAWEENRTRGSAVVKSLGWGPWNGGMVSSALKELFKSESIGLIDLDLGAKSAVKLLSDSPGGPAELLILGQGTDLSLLKPYLNREDGL